ncbi:hypothetical protein Pint_06814 [Pistacia integerrima]|uniref:Uncharacterized protein n=1 Tax=Pistacia integerrima TaxID=434235 RepID=A0ACC0XY45_9ROSI|nr:hypothetical protein Pint_06814 [Pistacia integerrima]
MILDTENLMKLYDENSGKSESGTENGTSKEGEVDQNANTYCYLRVGRWSILMLVLKLKLWRSVYEENLLFLRKILYFTFQVQCFSIMRNC